MMLEDDTWIRDLNLSILDDVSCEIPQEDGLGFEFGSQCESPNATYCKGLLEGLMNECSSGSSWGCSMDDTECGRPVRKGGDFNSDAREAAIEKIGVAYSGAPVREILNTLEVDDIMCERLAVRANSVKEATSNHDSVKPKAMFSATISEKDTPFTTSNIHTIYNILRRNINSLVNGKGGTIAYGLQGGAVCGLSITKHPPDYLELLMHCAACLASPQIDLSFLSLRSIPVQGQPNTYIYEIQVGDSRRWGYKPYYTDSTREVAYIRYTDSTIKSMSFEIQTEFKKRTQFLHFQATPGAPPKVSLPPELYDPCTYLAPTPCTNDIPVADCSLDPETGVFSCVCSKGHPLMVCDSSNITVPCQKRKQACRQTIDRTVTAFQCAQCEYRLCDQCYEAMLKETVAEVSLQQKEAGREAGLGLKFLVAVLARVDVGDVQLEMFGSLMKQLCITPGLLHALALMLFYKGPSKEEWQALGETAVICKDAILRRLGFLSALSVQAPAEECLIFAEITSCIPIPVISCAASRLLAQMSSAPLRLVAVLTRAIGKFQDVSTGTPGKVWADLFAVQKHALAFEVFFSLQNKHIKLVRQSFNEAVANDPTPLADKVALLSEMVSKNSNLGKKVQKHKARLPPQFQDVHIPGIFFQ